MLAELTKLENEPTNINLINHFLEYKANKGKKIMNKFEENFMDDWKKARELWDYQVSRKDSMVRAYKQVDLYLNSVAMGLNQQSIIDEKLEMMNVGYSEVVKNERRIQLKLDGIVIFLALKMLDENPKFFIMVSISKARSGRFIEPIKQELGDLYKEHSDKNDRYRLIKKETFQPIWTEAQSTKESIDKNVAALIDCYRKVIQAITLL